MDNVYSQIHVKLNFHYLITGNLVAMSYGTACGWPSAAYDILKFNETPLGSGPMTVDELSWMVSLLCVGGFVGNIFFGFITERWGRKIPLLSTALPMTVCFISFQLFWHVGNCVIPIQISWCLIVFATNPYYLYLARLLAGFCGAGAFILVPLFVAEIAHWVHWDHF